MDVSCRVAEFVFHFFHVRGSCIWPVGVPNVTSNGIFFALKSCARVAVDVAPVLLPADGIVPSSTMDLSSSIVNGRCKLLLRWIEFFHLCLVS